MSKEFKFLAIKNWHKYQGGRMKNRGDEKRTSWIKDYIEKEADPEYSKLSFFQRYVLDGCCRLRGRLGRNLPNDPSYIARALYAAPSDRSHLGHAIATLTSRGFLLLSNEQLNFTEEIRGDEIREEKRGGEIVSNRNGEAKAKPTPRAESPALPLSAPALVSSQTQKTEPPGEVKTPFELARAMMNDLGVPASSGDVSIVSHAIQLKAKNDGMTLSAARDFITEKAREAKTRGEFSKPIFWMRDASYDNGGANVPKSRAQRVGEDYRRRRGLTAATA